MTEWSAVQVEGLAPDASSLKAARKLATASKWTSPQRSERALWGELQGSGKKPYRTRVDLTGPAFKCSCPSRKFPCKHGLALLLVLAQDPAAVGTGTPPDWVEEWLTSRDARAERKAAPKQAPDPEAQERRRARREERIAAGLDELERWLLDVSAAGVAQTVDFAASARSLAARMVDAQAPGLEPRLQALAYARGGELAEAIGGLWLLVSAYRRLESLPAPLAASVRTAIGLAQRKSDVSEGERVTDRWHAVGVSRRAQGRLEERRVHLWGERTGRPALLLEFLAPGGAGPASISSSFVFEGDLAFYEAGFPWRVVLPDGDVNSGRFAQLPDGIGDHSVQRAVDRHVDALAADPWLSETPLLLRGVRIGRDDGHWIAVDTDGDALQLGPVSAEPGSMDAMAAVAERGVVDLAGTFDGDQVEVLAVFTRRGLFVSDPIAPALLYGVGA